MKAHAAQIRDPGTLAGPDGHLQGVCDQVRAHARIGLRAHDHPREHVDDERHVDEPRPRAHVREVRHPQLVRRLLVQSQDEFPEITTDPYRLWLTFAEARFADASAQSLLRPGVQPAEASWLFVSAFMGTKEILSYHRKWQDLPQGVETTITLVLPALVTTIRQD